MRVPIQWLEDYVNIDHIDQKELIEKLVLTGSNNEGTEKVCEDISNVVVGKIEKITAHPNADKLCICSVNVGDETIQIVTGATNISEGDCIPVAKHGAIIADGVKIRKGKLRGEPSNGMLCSLEELGYDKANIPKEFDDGILILNGDYELGMSIQEALRLNETIIDFEITPNRPDCLSMIGMARETAATYNLDLNYPSLELKNETGHIEGMAKVVIEAPDLCKRYVARVVKDIKIESSPMWMQLRLMHAGMRPINNIVDITNYVMLEYGQPIHAYDLDSVSDQTIIVKRAEEGEVAVTLDDKERKLSSETLVIADSKRTIGIAGIMGGGNTEISNETQNILIEVATFDKSNIRKSSKELGHRTEASSRFEKGVSAELPPIVVDRVCNLIETLKAGTVVSGMIDVYPTHQEEVKIPYRVNRICDVIGSDISEEEVIALLERLEIKTTREDNQLIATIPHFRLDLEKEIDLVEEVARLYGYDKIKMTLPQFNSWGARTNAQNIEEKTKFELLASGVDEILSYSFVSPRDLDKIQCPEDSYLRNQVRLINPLGEEYSVMRTSLIPNVLEVLARNSNRKCPGARIFEIGNIFLPRENELPIEKKVLTIGCYGDHEDFFTLKGIAENVFAGLGISGVRYEKEKQHPTYHPGRCANVVWNDHILGTIGEIHPNVCENFEMDSRMYVADLDFNILLQIARQDQKFTPIPKFPAIERDIAVLVKDEITSHEIEQVVKKHGGVLLESVKMFDLYKGKQIPEGYKSVAYELIFRAEDRTLVDDEVNTIFDKVLKELETELEAQLR